MDDKKESLFLGYEIEGSIKNICENAYKILQKPSDNPKEYLDQLCAMFSSLGKSRPNAVDGLNWCPEKDIRWARDIIEAYRNFVQLLIIFNDKYGGDLTLKKLEKTHNDLIGKFGGEIDTTYDKIDTLLNYFYEVNHVLEKYEIDSASDLEDRLDEVGSLKEDSKKLDNLYDNFENFERDFS